MAPSQASIEGSVRTVIHQPVKISEAPGPYDALFRSVRPQHPNKARLEGPPRAPPMAATRKHTPVRPVYDDFATAHSSITSGSANGRSRDMSHKSPKTQFDFLDRSRPLSRRTLKSLRRQKKPTQKKEDLTMQMPMPVKVSHHRPISEFDFDISGVPFTASRQPEARPSPVHPPNVDSQTRAFAPSFFDGLRRAMGGISSPVANSAQGRLSRSYIWARDSMELPGLARKGDQLVRKEAEDSEYETGIPIQPGDGRQPEQQLYLEDPFVYDSNQYPAPLGRVGTNAFQAINGNQARKNNQIDADFHDKHDAGIGPDHNDALVDEDMDAPTYINGGMTLAIDSQVTPSTREGSTVDKIVKQYARNSRLWDISLDSNDEDSEEDNGYFRHSKPQDRFQNDMFSHGGLAVDDSEKNYQSSHDTKGEKPFQPFKLTESSGQAPSAGLPQIPSLLNQQSLRSVSEGLEQASSYGNTRNLLDITQRSQMVTTTSPTNAHQKIGVQPNPKFPSHSNPFRHGLNLNPFALSAADADSSPNSHLSQKVARTPSESTEYLAGSPLHALERDISLALRRLSAFSNLSQETSNQDLGDGDLQSSTDPGGPLTFIGKRRQRILEARKLVPSRFYHEPAIHQTWLDSQRFECVRIPIGCAVSVSSLPGSHSTLPGADEFDLQGDGLEQNGNDWETIVDGVMGKVNTAGSSLANNSSAGDISPRIYQHNDFSSTDRIVQHPAQIDYSHDYRYREIKMGNFPVLLPSYKPHTVNGFPVNSYRSFQQSSVDFYQSPPPLSRGHTNPFRSLPPEVITKQSSSEGVDHDEFLVNKSPKSKLEANQMANRGDSIHWLDECVDPGPGIKPTQPALDPGTIRLSSNSLSESYSGSQLVGSSIADASSSTLSAIIHDLGDLDGIQQGSISYVNHASAHVNGAPSAARERTPFVKGPPGAFYQGVRSQPDPRRKGLSPDGKPAARHPQRKAPQKYPTNQMRPLSLLQAQRGEPAIRADGSSLGERPHDDFLYRSPLAPIKSRSWCDLYTREQLSSMHTAAKGDGVSDVAGIARRSSRPAVDEDMKTDGSWKRLPWSPHMRPWPRDNSSIKADLAGRKVKLSSLIFGLCCLFPPMLVLYGVGYLDNIMLWITEGEISAFSKAHKRAALQVVCFFIVAILIAVPTVIGIKVSGSK